MEELPQLQADDSIQLLQMHISVRSYNAIANLMRYSELETIGQLRSDDVFEDLKRTQNCGKKSLKEIGQAIRAPWLKRLEPPLPAYLAEIPIEHLLLELARRRPELEALCKLSRAVRDQAVKTEARPLVNRPDERGFRRWTHEARAEALARFEQLRKYKDVGKHYGLSTERTRQVIAEAIKRELLLAGCHDHMERYRLARLQALSIWKHGAKLSLAELRALKDPDA